MGSFCIASVCLEVTREDAFDCLFSVTVHTDLNPQTRVFLVLLCHRLNISSKRLRFSIGTTAL